MSTTPPPPGPPSHLPPFGPPSGPPPGAPPAPEVLDSAGGGPVPPPPPIVAGGGRRRWWWAGAGVAAVAVLGGGAFAAWWYTSTGPQPAEALPAGTLMYASVDLDPSGKQKLDALETLKKFPALAEELDLGGDAGDVDLRRELGELLVEEADCEGLSYADDIGPWVGDRLAMAGVESDGELVPVIAIQVTDGDAARAAVEVLDECDGATEPSGAVVDGDWMLLAETQEIAEEVAAAAEKGTLADDDDYRRWTEEAGGAGIVTLYAAPEAGSFLGEMIEDEAGGLGDLVGRAEAGLVSEALEEFEGAAMVLRFDDGAVELEMAAAGTSADAEALQGDRGAEAMKTLPEGTLAALGVGFDEGWFGRIMEIVAEQEGEDVDDLMAEAEATTDLDLPQDAEALLGESAVLAVGPDLDLSAIFGSGDLEDFAVAFKAIGDTDAIEEVVEKIRAVSAGPDGMLEPRVRDGAVTAGVGERWSEEVAEGGDLGDSAGFRDVIREADRASVVFYLDFDALFSGDRAIDDEEVAENLEPLGALGATSWIDGEVSHSVLRLTTD